MFQTRSAVCKLLLGLLGPPLSDEAKDCRYQAAGMYAFFCEYAQYGSYALYCPMYALFYAWTPSIQVTGSIRSGRSRALLSKAGTRAQGRAPDAHYAHT